MKELFNKYYSFIAIFLIALTVIAFFDKALAFGLIVLALLMSVTFFILSRLGLKNKTLTKLLIIALIIHLGAVLFIYYFNFQPFSGGAGGFKTAHIIATELSENFREGNFSFEGVPYYENGRYPYRYYALVIGVLYTITMPEMIIGQIFQVWLALLMITFVYLIIKELGSSNKWAFTIGLITSFYPSHLFYASLLLKDGLVAVLALSGLLLSLKLIKKFSWKYWFLFYIILAGLFNFRFYIGYALLFAFLISYLFLFNLNFKKKLKYAIIVIPMLCFLPEILLGHGFLGVDVFKSTFTEKNITFYQQEAYSSPVFQAQSEIKDGTESVTITDSSSLILSTFLETPASSAGYYSTWERKEVSFRENPSEFLKNNLKYSSYILLGPFPWQMTRKAHFFALLETIPWYLLFFFIIKGIYQSIKNYNKLALFLILFSLMVLVAMTIFINNYGIITRIRIPAFIALLCLIPLGFKKKNMELVKIYD